MFSGKTYKKLIVLSSLVLLVLGCTENNDEKSPLNSMQVKHASSHNPKDTTKQDHPIGASIASSHLIKRLNTSSYESFEGGGWNARNTIFSEHTPGLSAHLPKNFLFSQLQGPHSFAVERDIVRLGESAAKLHWKHGEPEKWNGNVYVLTNTDRKAMFHGNRASTNLATLWYGFSVYFPSEGTQLTQNQQALFFQLHGARDSNEEPNRIPPLALNITPKGFKISHAWDAKKISTSAHGEGQRAIDVPVALVDYQNRWVDFVLQVRSDPFEAKGFVKLWIDGKQMVNLKDIKLGYNDVKGIYPSWGWYLWGDNAYRQQDAIMYLDELRQAEGTKANYFDVAPGVFSTTP